MSIEIIALIVVNVSILLIGFAIGFYTGVMTKRKADIIEGYREAMSMKAESFIAFMELYLKQRGDKNGT